MDAASLLQQLAVSAHQWLESTVGEVTSEQAHWQPPKGVNIGAHYAHIVNGEDVLINEMAKGEKSLAATTWEGKMGLSEPLPWGPLDAWSRSATIDMPTLRAYGQAVFAGTEAYIGSLTADDLDRPIDLTGWGMGMMPLGTFIGAFAIGNTNWHCGEISFVKGLQGLKGYPV